MKMLDDLEYKYAMGGPVQAKQQALAAVQQAMAHVQNGNHGAAMQVLQNSPAAMMHPEVRAAARQLRPQGQMPMQRMDDGGPVRGSSSPGSPGVLGAIKDAAAALKDYYIDRPGREADAAAQHRIDVISGQVEDPDGHASGGSISDPPNQHIGSGSLIHSLLSAASTQPDQAQVLHAHALALLQANLNAAHALHTSTGESGPYRQYMALANALGGGQSAMAIAPLARQAANMAVPQGGGGNPGGGQSAPSMGPGAAPSTGTGYAAGGSVPGEPAKGQISKMFHFMVNKMGINPEDAAKFAVNYHETGSAGGQPPAPPPQQQMPAMPPRPQGPPPGAPPTAPGPQGPPMPPPQGPQMPPPGPPMQQPPPQQQPRPQPPPQQPGGASPQNPPIQLPAPMSPQTLQQMQMMQAAQRSMAARGS
jgi:hypothetical protein